MYDYGQRQVTALGVKLGWKLDTAAGIGHSDNDMSVFAAEWLFGNKAGLNKTTTTLNHFAMIPVDRNHSSQRFGQV
jgi:hypothetical protein